MKTSAVFEKDALFEYNRAEKIKSEIFKWSVIGLIVIFIGSYLLNLFEGTFIERFFSYIGVQMFSGTIFGYILFGLIAGLFFVSVPIEVVFIAFLKTGNNSFFVFIFVFFGLLLSYLSDYYIGFHFSRISRKLISPKQFYGVKVKLNQYGKWAIIFFNILPLPSQLLTFICGVFRYNKTRYFTLWTISWLIKLSVIVFIVKFF